METMIWTGDEQRWCLFLIICWRALTLSCLVDYYSKSKLLVAFTCLAKKNLWASNTRHSGNIVLQSSYVGISDTQDPIPKLIENLFENIHNNDLLTLGARVVTCVVYGVLLPSVAFSFCKNPWSDLLALVIGIGPIFIHISYEIYIIVIQNNKI